MWEAQLLRELGQNRPLQPPPTPRSGGSGGGGLLHAAARTAIPTEHIHFVIANGKIARNGGNRPISSSAERRRRRARHLPGRGVCSAGAGPPRGRRDLVFAAAHLPRLLQKLYINQLVNTLPSCLLFG